MANSHGSGADVIGNGYVLSPFLNSAHFSGTRDAGETTTFQKTSKTYIPGLKDTNMSCEGIFDGVVDAVDDILQQALQLSTDSLFTYIPEGAQGGASDLGNLSYTMEAIETSYEVTTAVGDVAQISAEFNAGSTGYFTRGRVNHPYQLEASAGNSSSIDLGAVSTTNGGSLVAHVTASSSLVLFLQDSADNSTFADLAGSLTFASGRASKRLVIPGTIRRYTRIRWTGSGTFLALVDRF